MVVSTRNLVWSVISLLAIGVRASPTSALTFDDAWKMALTNAVSVRSAANEKELAAQRKELGFYENDPTLAFQSSITQRYRDTSGATGGGAAQDPRTTEQLHSLNLSIPLIDFGRSTARERQLDLELQAAVAGEKEMLTKLHFDVARAYLAAAAAQRSIEITKEQIKIADTRAREQNRLYQQGMRPESDVLAAQVDLGSAQISLQQAEDDALTARMRLAAVLGVTDHNSLSTLMPPPLRIDPRALVDFLEFLEKTPAQPAPSQQRRSLQLEALGASLDQVKASTRPRLNGALGAQAAGSFTPVKPHASAALALAWEIPWSGQNRDQQQLNALQRQSIELSGAQEELQRQTQWQTGQHSFNSARRSAIALIDQEKIVERQQRLVQQRYNSGRATALELSSSEAAVINVRQSLARVGQQAVGAAIDAAEAKGMTSLDTLFQTVLKNN